MSYVVLPSGRITVTLPPSAVICKFCGTWVNARVALPPPVSMPTSAEAMPLASTLPPSVDIWKLPVRPLTVISPPPVSTRVVPVPDQSSASTLPPSVAIWRVPVSPLAVRSPPPESSCRLPARLVAFTSPPAADSDTPLEKPDAVMLPPLLHTVTAVRAGTSREALIAQLVLIPLQSMPMLAPVGVMLSLMPGRMRPYWTVPVSRAAARGLLQRDVAGVDVHRHLAVLHRDRVTERIAPPGHGRDQAEAGPADQGQGHRHADREGHPAARRHEQGPQRAAGSGRRDRGLAGGGHEGHRDTPFIRCRGSAARRGRDDGRGRRAPVRVW